MGAVILRAKTLRQAFAEVGNHGPGFDTIRLVAASSVVLHHSLVLQIDPVRDDWLFAFSNGYTQLGLLAVSLFFALSGFLVTPGLTKNGNVIEYLSRRFMRIMPLLVLVVATTALLVGPLLTTLSLADYFANAKTWLYLKNMTTSLSLQLPGVTSHNGTSNVNGALWTLRYEWMCYIILAGASLAGLLRRKWLFLALWAGAMVAMLMLYGPLTETQDKNALFVLLFLFGYFGAGTLLYLFGDRVPVSFAWACGALAALLLCLGSKAAFVLAPPLIAYLVIVIGTCRFPWSDLLAKADLSYGLYLTHAVVLTILTNIWPFTSSLLLFVTGLGVSLCVAWCTWTFVEQPALQHKSLPGRICREALSRVGLRA
ncbi:acyltransferase [Novosphingobium sp. AAP83]|uniref:acyltransferase family protein n=1 Tax=Novosphingobium sp. AAP83 TaxID=1523425 RepID=UPI0018D1601B|nr:acyltransferase [Novosphingobium sp. AAP83]